MLKKLLLASVLGFFGLAVQAQNEPVSIIELTDGVSLDYSMDNQYSYSFKNFEANGILTFNGVAGSDPYIKFIVQPGWTEIFDATSPNDGNILTYKLSSSDASALNSGSTLVVQGQDYTFTSLTYTAPEEGEGGEDNPQPGEGEETVIANAGQDGYALSWDENEIFVQDYSFRNFEDGGKLIFNGKVTGNSPYIQLAVSREGWTEIINNSIGTSDDEYTYILKGTDVDLLNKDGQISVKGADYTLYTVTYVAPAEGDKGQEDLEGAFVPSKDGVFFADWEVDPVQIPAAFFENATANDVLRIYYNAESGAQIQLAYHDQSLPSGSQWTMVVEADNISGEGYKSVSLASILSDVQADGFFVKGINFSFVKATLVLYSGVECIEAVAEEETPAVYYNLQGVRVANPANGIFIRVQGNKVTKEIIR